MHTLKKLIDFENIILSHTANDAKLKKYTYERSKNMNRHFNHKHVMREVSK